MSRAPGTARAAAASRAAEARIARGLGEPALFAVALSAVGSSIYFVLGVLFAALGGARLWLSRAHAGRDA